MKSLSSTYSSECVQLKYWLSLKSPRLLRSTNPPSFFNSIYWGTVFSYQLQFPRSKIKMPLENTKWFMQKFFRSVKNFRTRSSYLHLWKTFLMTIPFSRKRAGSKINFFYFYFIRFQRATRKIMEDMSGIEHLLHQVTILLTNLQLNINELQLNKNEF